MTPSDLHRLAALLDGPDPWPEVLPAVEAEPITSAQRERLLRVFDATAGGSPSAPPRAARGRMENEMDESQRNRTLTAKARDLADAIRQHPRRCVQCSMFGERGLCEEAERLRRQFHAATSEAPACEVCRGTGQRGVRVSRSSAMINCGACGGTGKRGRR